MRIFPLKPQTATNPESGFSLLEMLIVLSIMGLMLSLVGARFMTSIESTRFARTADAGISSIKLLRAEAMLYNLPLRVIGTGEDAHIIARKHQRRLDLPKGWTVTGDTLVISKTGICSGGKITLQGPSTRKAIYQLAPPLCEPRRVPTPRSSQQ